MDLGAIFTLIAIIYFFVCIGRDLRTLIKGSPKKAAEAERDEALERVRLIQLEAQNLQTEVRNRQQVIAELQSKINQLEPYIAIADATAELQQIKKEIRAQQQAIQQKINDAETKAHAIINRAYENARNTAGEALDAKANAELYSQTATAMRNIIKGYGDEYLKPTHSLIDDLAEEMGHTGAAQKLKEARKESAAMVKKELAADCDYVETERRVTAIRFIVDAFNGKVDAILSRVKHDNYGKLEQEIRDAFALVNLHGKPFRSARIKKEYLEARLQELNWAAITHQLREQEKEEQRRIKEQIREEERARREYAKAMQEAEREEASIQKAMERVTADLAKANDEQRARYELQLAELAEKLKAAEEKSQRALSMAQQTKTGHVYVISNIGSFGENVYKIGLTRRLEPLDRVKELGDASVPFDFDVHAMIHSTDAPALEHALHKHFVQAQVNKVNPRKEFFRVNLEELRREVEALGIDNVHWTMTAAASQYRETLAIERQAQENPEEYQEWLEEQLEEQPDPVFTDETID